MAEAFFNQLAKGKVKALSAGTDPADAIDPTVVKAMREVDLDISGNNPKALSPEMAEQADTVVTMGCGVEGVCPATFVKTEDWALEDPRGKPLGKVREIKPLRKVREIRDEIKVRVMKMLEEAEA
jgi:protein-tyrosine-phosphatase